VEEWFMSLKQPEEDWRIEGVKALHTNLIMVERGKGLISGGVISEALTGSKEEWWIEEMEVLHAHLLMV
jgi:hypothetical protein